MIYKVDCPTPANTSKRAPRIFRVRVAAGITRQEWIGFPHMCFGLCHLQVWHWGIPVWPWSPDDSFNWNNHVFTFYDEFRLTTEPLEFVVKTWNLDDVYPHTPFFAVHVQPDLAPMGVVDLDQVFLDLGIEPGE